MGTYNRFIFFFEKSAGLVAFCADRVRTEVTCGDRVGISPPQLLPDFGFFSDDSMNKSIAPAMLEGKCVAKESEPVLPVDENHIVLIQPHVNRQIWALMVSRIWVS